MTRSNAAVTAVQPADVFAGVVLIAVPHMDDEALACNGTVARLPDKTRIHLVYATDGMKSPEPVLPWRDRISPDLGARRREESVAAMTMLGVPRANITFLELPEGRLEQHEARLTALMRELIGRVRPDHVLAPFRYDRHRDHIAVNRAVTEITSEVSPRVQLWEYFVYHRWRLLPRRDVREYIRPGQLLEIDISKVSGHKRAALDCFTSQTTQFYPWQSRPNLTPELLDAVSREPELFLKHDPALPGPRIFSSMVWWIRIAHRLESPLKWAKDRLVAVSRRVFGRSVASA
jgi:LmbE family N-acetylglucosaminyl deacetylase